MAKVANVRVPPVEPADSTTANKGAAFNDRYDQSFNDWWRDAWSDYANIENEPEETVFGYIRDF